MCALGCASKIENTTDRATKSDGGDAASGGSAAGHGGADASETDKLGFDNADPGAIPIAGTAADSGAAADSAGNEPIEKTPEVCDGIDNDGNGIIDDIDVQHDGVCDCLRIATIGQIGPWSDGGNVFKKWLNERSSTPAVALGDMVLTDDLLRTFQVIVVLHAAPIDVMANGSTTPGHHVFSDAEAAAFVHWVQAGGGAMTTIGYTLMQAQEVVNVNQLLSPFDMAYSTSKFDLNGDIGTWIPHPITQDIKKVYIEHGVEPSGNAGMTLAYDDSNHVALQVLQVKEGRLVVWGDEWITYDSQWQSVRDQQVERLWLNILKWLSPPKACQVPLPALF